MTSLRREESTMWKHGIGLALIGVALVTVAVSVSAASALDKPRTFSLLEVEGTFVRLGGWAQSERPPVGGDQFTTTGTLYRWSGPNGKGPRVGRNRVLLTFLSGFGANLTRRVPVFVIAQVYLPDGTLLVEGYGTIPPGAPAKLKLPVIGGTGVYANARGYLAVRNLRGGESRSRLDFHLVP
jgi:hypothetical protein